jgi:cell division protein FtsQ
MRQSLEQLPWVRTPKRGGNGRQGSSRIEEHAPVAYWGEATGQLVNTYGEVFHGDDDPPPPSPMPMLFGPPAGARNARLLPAGRRTAQAARPRTAATLTISPRLAVQIRWTTAWSSNWAATAEGAGARATAAFRRVLPERV